MSTREGQRSARAHGASPPSVREGEEERRGEERRGEERPGTRTGVEYNVDNAKSNMMSIVEGEVERSETEAKARERTRETEIEGAQSWDSRT